MDKSEVFAAISRLRRYTWPHSLGNDVLTVIEAYEELVTSVIHPVVTAVKALARSTCGSIELKRLLPPTRPAGSQKNSLLIFVLIGNNMARKRSHGCGSITNCTT